MGTFEVPHKPGYRLKMRMGIHSGSVVAGVVGTKIPHYSVFGETVETAGLMESTGESMKIQISTETKELLKAAGGFNIIKRDTTHPKLPDGMRIRCARKMRNRRRDQRWADLGYKKANLGTALK